VALPDCPGGKEESKPNAGTAAQGGGGKNNKKKVGGNQLLAGIPTAVVAAATAGGGRGGKRGGKRPPTVNSDEGSVMCPVHNSTRCTTSECWEIKKLTEQFREKMQQQPRKDGTPSHQREGKQKVDKEKDEEMEFQNAKKTLKMVYGNSDSESSDNECRKALHNMFGGSWDITSRRIIKTLR
jgi:hypothetical protein